MGQNQRVGVNLIVATYRISIFFGDDEALFAELFFFNDDKSGTFAFVLRHPGEVLEGLHDSAEMGGRTAAIIRNPSTPIGGKPIREAKVQLFDAGSHAIFAVQIVGLRKANVRNQN